MNKKTLSLGFILLTVILAGIIFATSNQQKETEPSAAQQSPIAEKDQTKKLDQIIDLTSQKTVEMNIEKYRFQKNNIKIKVGTTVTWTNQDTVEHNAFSNSKIGPTGTLLKKGQSYSYTFNEAGKIDYFCIPHPYMVAAVEVVQ